MTIFDPVIFWFLILAAIACVAGYGLLFLVFLLDDKLDQYFKGNEDDL